MKVKGMKDHNLHIPYMDLGHGVIIENDELKRNISEDCHEDDDILDFDAAFVEMIEMAEKIDNYCNENEY